VKKWKWMADSNVRVLYCDEGDASWFSDETQSRSRDVAPRELPFASLGGEAFFP